MADLLPPLAAAQIDAKSKVDEKVDYSNLPCPVSYDELNREAISLVLLITDLVFLLDIFFLELIALFSSWIAQTDLRGFNCIVLSSGFVSLKADTFEGLRFDFAKGLNQKFSLCHRRLLTNEPHMSHAMFNFDYMGSDYRAQFQLGNGALVGATYIQSVTHRLSLGGEVFWAGVPRKSGLGYAARYETDKMVLDAKEQIEARDMYWEAVSSDASKEGYLERAEERFVDAEREAERGLVLLLQWGSPWDKRMSWEGWIAWVRVLLMKSSDQSWPDVSWGILNLGLVR
ncbi:hypothetical protein DY000_02004624 [Brassica cretica]|uniref:Uncharacterized protein n=1 Tax=Brassica cretica TaxID=69181 RepID=A0ABQ7CA64_BRACR|nr:hypothetical protein DY000_02004624 [Brassica cretica]